MWTERRPGATRPRAARPAGGPARAASGAAADAGGPANGRPRPSRVPIRPRSDDDGQRPAARPRARGVEDGPSSGIAWGYGKASALRDRRRSVSRDLTPRPGPSGPILRLGGDPACRRSRRVTLRDPSGFGQSSFPAIPPGPPPRHRGGPLGGVGPRGCSRSPGRSGAAAPRRPRAGPPRPGRSAGRSTGGPPALGEVLPQAHRPRRHDRRVGPGPGTSWAQCCTRTRPTPSSGTPSQIVRLRLRPAPHVWRLDSSSEVPGGVACPSLPSFGEKARRGCRLARRTAARHGERPLWLARRTVNKTAGTGNGIRRRARADSPPHPGGAASPRVGAIRDVPRSTRPGTSATRGRVTHFAAAAFPLSLAAFRISFLSFRKMSNLGPM